MYVPKQYSLLGRRALFRCIALLLASIAGLALPRARAAEWQQYRGPNHDGSTAESLRTDWAASPPKVLWKKSIAPAWSTFSISQGKLFTQAARSNGSTDREYCIALDAATGTELWARELDAADYPDAGTGDTDGPRSTPTVDGDRVYVFTSYLKLYCLRADTGAVVWKRDFIQEFPGTTVIDWQNAASPLLVGDLLYVNSNVSNRRLMAIHKLDGVTAWSTQDDRMTHASPVYATLGDRPQVLFLTAKGLVGVTPDTGSVLWRHSFTPSSTSTAASPIASGDIVYASCAYALGAWTARVTGSGNSFSVSATDYKRGSAYQNHWATPVAHNGYVYGIVENGFRSLACFNLSGRTNRWITQSVGGQNPGYGSLIKVGGKLLVLTERGRLVLLEPNPEKYDEIARFDVLSGTCWNHPIFSNGRLYARSSTQMVAVDLAPPTVALPPLEVSAQWLPETKRLRVEARAADASVLNPAAAPRLELQTRPTLAAAASWTAAPLEFTAANGAFIAELPLDAGFDQQFVRIRVRD